MHLMHFKTAHIFLLQIVLLLNLLYSKYYLIAGAKSTLSDILICPFHEWPLPKLLGSKPPTNKSVLLHFHDGFGGYFAKKDDTPLATDNVVAWWQNGMCPCPMPLPVCTCP